MYARITFGASVGVNCGSVNLFFRIDTISWFVDYIGVELSYF